MQNVPPQHDEKQKNDNCKGTTPLKIIAQNRQIWNTTTLLHYTIL